MFHRGKQRVLGKAGGRFCDALFHRCLRVLYALALGQRRERGGRFRGFLFDCREKRPLSLFPALRDLRAAFRGKQSAATFQSDGGFRIGVRLAHGAEQADGDHVKDVPLAFGEGGKIGSGDLRRGNQRVVVADLCAVYHKPRIDRGRRGVGEWQRPRYHGAEIGKSVRHIVGQIAGIRARVGCQLLFIEHLHIVKRLLGGIVKQAVGLALKRGEVVELRRALRFLLRLR